MKYIDILGQPIEQGDRVAFAQTRGGSLALGHVVETGLVRERNGHAVCRLVRVRLESNGRGVNLPYHAEKYVVIQKGPTPESQLPLSTRALQAVQRLYAIGLHVAEIGHVRATLNLPFSESHDVYLALESLVESGELLRAPYPPYAYLPAGE